jgi:hypothetical protein
MISFFAPISRDSPTPQYTTRTSTPENSNSQPTAGTASAATGRHPNYKAKHDDPHCVVLMLLEPAQELLELKLTTHTNTSGEPSAYSNNNPAPQDHREFIHTTVIAAPAAAPAPGDDERQDPQQRKAQQLARRLAGDIDYEQLAQQLAQLFNVHNSKKSTWAYQTLNRVRRSDEVAWHPTLKQSDIFWRPLLVISGFQNQHEARAFNQWGKDPKQKTRGKRKTRQEPAAIYFGHPRTHRRVLRERHSDTQELLNLPKRYPFRDAPAVLSGLLGVTLEDELATLRDYRGELLHPSVRRIVGTFFTPWNRETRNNPQPRETHTIPLTAFWYRPEFAPAQVDYKPQNITYAALALPVQVNYPQRREEQLAQQQEEEEQLAQQQQDEEDEEQLPQVQLAQQLYNSTEHFLRPETPENANYVNNSGKRRRNVNTNNFSL